MNNKYTPSKVALSAETFHIPLYQRLFEWDKEQITTLLEDLYSSYSHHLEDEQPYYVGMLTALDNKGKELVDGQQRFTVITLMGIVMREFYPEWNKFLKKDNICRLDFKARPNDQEYLSSQIDKREPKYINTKMKRGLSTIENYIASLKEGHRIPFCEYVFRNLTFFISELPKDYHGRQLNTYFEAMNATGKNLENHEILKVDIIHNIQGDKTLFTRVWNMVADMDKPLIRKKTLNREKEDVESFRNRYMNAFYLFDNSDIVNVLGNQDKDTSILNDLYKTSDSYAPSEFPAISEIAPSQEKPKRAYRSEGYRSMLRFTNFLLQVLWIRLPDDKRNEIEVNVFFDNNNLLETFKNYASGIDGEQFIISLLKYRLLYDYYLIRISNEREDYYLEMGDSEEDDNARLKLKQFESLLYVYSSDKSYYLWFSPMMEHLMKNRLETSGNLLNKLKKIDNLIHDNHAPDISELTYQRIDRYWFWRLDYYIWEDRDALFAEGGLFHNFEQYKPLVDSYILRRNRSVEHVSPQHPEGHKPLERLHEFGNLVMISSGLNTSLSNSEYAEKRGHVEACMANGLLIESLAMILLYKQHGDDIWTDEDIKNRTTNMYEIIIKSFNHTPL